MAFIKVQKFTHDASGAVTGGSAAIVNTLYVSAGNRLQCHCRHEVMERLGRILYLSPDRRSGVFQSPTRGVVEYSSADNSFREVQRDDPRISSSGLFPAPELHTVFGDAYSAAHMTSDTPSYDALLQRRRIGIHMPLRNLLADERATTVLSTAAPTLALAIQDGELPLLASPAQIAWQTPAVLDRDTLDRLQVLLDELN